MFESFFVRYKKLNDVSRIEKKHSFQKIYQNTTKIEIKKSCSLNRRVCGDLKCMPSIE